MVSETEICEIVHEAPAVTQAVDRLIEQAKCAGGYDNITAVIAECEAE
jgi:serine/threonine protein phosphatase PrpC